MMSYQQEKFEKFRNLVEEHAQEEGINLCEVEGFGTFKASSTQSRIPVIDVQALFIVAQGRKFCYAGNHRYDYSPGKALAMFFPMSVEVEYVEASPENPFLAAGVVIDKARMADVLLRLDRIEGATAKPISADPSGIVSVDLDDALLNPFIRILEALSDPVEAAFLSDAMMDEIYFRLLTGERGGELRDLLQQRGEIQRISKAVEYIHQNLDQTVSVEKLAGMVHMGQTSFFENFRKVMHVSPLQYAKSVKLSEAQRLIREGRKANEAGYMVGYNSPAQFSREYKRHFGFVPSAT
jgi:AraC-like DNA-binding protein